MDAEISYQEPGHFWAFRRIVPDPDDQYTEFVAAKDVQLSDALKCPVCDRYMTMLRLVPPIRGALELTGKNFGDFAFGAGGDIFVSNKFKELFQATDLVGIDHFEPVEITRIRGARRGQKPPRYWLISTRKSTAAIDDLASGLDRGPPEPCPDCRLGGIISGYARIVLEPGTWSGEDIFEIRGLPSAVLVSGKFKSFCDSAGLVGLPIVPIESRRFPQIPPDPSGRKMH